MWGVGWLDCKFLVNALLEAAKWEVFIREEKRTVVCLWVILGSLFHLVMPLFSPASISRENSWPSISSTAGAGDLDVLVNILKTENKSIHLCKKCCPQEKLLIISKAKCTGTSKFTTSIDYFIINCSLAFLHLLLNRNETPATENINS